jgi:hypothetical protein
MGAGEKGYMSLELDGPGASPTKVDSLALLRLAEAWFRLADRVAIASGKNLNFRGLDVRRKCVAVACAPSNLRLAKTVAAKALRIVDDKEDAPKGADKAAADVRKYRRALLVGQSVVVRVGAWSEPMVTPTTVPAEYDTWETTELRVIPVRVGGGEPSARLTSTGESTPFTVEVGEDHARALGAHLYQQIDVELRLLRAPDGHVKGGRVVDVHPLEPGGVDLWRAWLRDNAGQWDDVDDVMGELGRSH